MRRNTAYGRTPAHERLRLWWSANITRSRANAMLVVGVGAVFVLLIMAATARDAARTPRANASQPRRTLGGLPTASTLVLGGPGATVPPTVLDSTTTTTTTTTKPTVVVSTTVPAPPTTARPVAPTTTVTRAAPATTVPTSDVIFNPAPTTSTAPPTTLSPATTTTIVPSTMVPPTTVPPATTTTTAAPRAPLPIGLQPLLGS